MDIKLMNDVQLLREYRELRKDSFCRMFGHNARIAMNECVDELLSRGITMEPNLFGDMPIDKWESA